MIHFTADLHFNHKGIIDFCDRPFKQIWAMNRALIDNWNAHVRKEDTIYVLGDFIWGSPRHAKEILEELKGKIFLIPGSHDKRVIKKLSRYFINTEFPRIYEIKYEGQHIILCHYCMRTWPRSHYNSWHLYAHSHGGLAPIGKSWDAGVDNNNQPLSFYDVKNIMAGRPDNPNYVGGREE